MVRSNGLFPSFSTPLFQSEAKCKAIDNNNNNNNNHNHKTFLYLIYIFFYLSINYKWPSEKKNKNKKTKINQKTMIHRREFENKLTKELLKIFHYNLQTSVRLICFQKTSR